MKLVKVKYIEKLKEPKQCYDVTVSNNHNFFANGILLHNCDYRQELKLLLYNTDSTRGDSCRSEEPLRFKKGDRLAQALILPVVQPEITEVDELDETERKGGFGHTGK